MIYFLTAKLRFGLFFIPKQDIRVSPGETNQSEVPLILFQCVIAYAQRFVGLQQGGVVIGYHQ
jgi:hypothetical protein